MTAGSTSDARRARLIGLTCLLVTSTGWGINWTVVKFLLTEWPPLFARGLAGMIASLIVFAVALGSGEAIRIPRGCATRLALSGLFNVFAWMGFSSLALRWLTAGQGAMLVYTMPAWATLLAWPLLGKRPSAAALAGLGLCFVGIALLFGGGGRAIGSAELPGAAFALLAASLFALGTVALRPVPLPPFAQLGWQLAIGCAPMIAFGVAFERPDVRALDATGVAAMAYMSVVAMGVCYLAWFAALRRLPPATASMGTLLTPAIGVVFAAFALGEGLGPRQLAALALVIAGVALALRRR